MSLLLIVVSYMLAVKPTVALWSANGTLEQQIRSSKDLGPKLALVEQDLQALKMYYSSDQASSKHDDLLEQLSHAAEQYQLVIVDFPAAEMYKEQQYWIESNTILVKGAYKDILQLVFDIEQTYKIGRVVSVVFAVERDRKAKKEFLTAQIIVQNIKPVTDDV